MTAVILAAGKGKRLGQDFPKSLNRIGSMSILQRQLNSFKKTGVDELVVVVGYQKEKLIQAIRKNWPGPVQFVENNIYETTNTVYSLCLAIEHVKGDFFYANSDVVFRADLPARLCGHRGDAALGIVVGKCGPEEVKVIVEGTRIVRIDKKLPPQQCLGEFIGVAWFSGRMLGKFRTSLADVISSGMSNEYFEAALDRITDTTELTAVDITDIPCVEIDFPEDLSWAVANSTEFDRDI